MNLPSTSKQTHLGVFAKYWEPGTVKTRLGQQIGMIPAATIYRQFVRTLTSQLSHTANSRSVFFSPPEHKSAFQSLLGNDWALVPQCAGDLGRRMSQFFTNSLSNGLSNSHVVLIGSDTPTLPSALIEQAFRSLQNVSCVLGPSPDGGYYLIGLNQHYAFLFDEIAWSTNQVYPRTCELLESHQIGYEVLPEWNDIDDLSDLIELNGQLDELVAQTPLDINEDGSYAMLRQTIRDTVELDSHGIE